MNKKLLFLTVLFSFISFSKADANVNWITDFESAQKLALSSNKLILVDFWASWCGPCRKMDSDAWSQKEVSEIVRNFVPLKIDLDSHKALALKYNVNSIPNVFLMDGNGKIIFESTGYMGKEEVIRVLEPFTLNTQFLQKESINYYKKQNYITALHLADSYLTYSLYLPKSIRNDVINVAERYLKESESLLDKEQSNFDLIQQKIELLEIMVDLYSRNFKKVDRKLSKIKSKDLKSKNKSLYNYINYCNDAIQHRDPKKWIELLQASDSSEYLKKYDIFLKSTYF